MHPKEIYNYSGVHWKMNIPHLCTKLHNYTVLFYHVKMPVSMPVEIEVHTVPHFKAPVNGKEGC